MAGHIDEVKSTTSGGTLPFPTAHDRLMNELESSEGQLGAIIRSLYDDKDQDEFLVSLSTRIKQHEKDIERMCNKNYQGFIESVTQLVKVKSEAHKLKNKVIEADKRIQDSGNELLKDLKDLHTSRAIQNNITSTIETLTLCIPVLEMYGKLQNLMKERHYYSALKTLEQLEHIHLPCVRGYIFSELLAEEIPRMRESIEKQSMAELKEYLTKVRDVSVVIGEVAMHQVQRMARLELSSNVRQLLLKDESIKVETASTQDIVDFSPVYRCLHIHFVLGRRDRFIEEYRNERRQQLRLAIKPPTKVDDIQEFKRYFFQIVGFFVVEDTILHTCQSSSGGHKEESEQGLMSQPVLDEFWEMATSEMLSVLRHHCLHCQDNHLLLKIKQLIVWFCHTVMGYGFNNDKLYEVALEIREHYDDLLMKTNGDAFQNLLASDDYTPVIVETDQQFQGIMEMFNYKDLQIHHVPFPKKLPFSSMVIQIYEQIKSFINSSWGYSDRLNLSRTEIDEAVRRSVNLLLTRSLSGCLATLITKDKLTIRQLVQLWVNLDQWEGAEDDLDMYISSVTKVPRSDAAGVQSRLYGFSVFKDAKLSTQVKISSKLEEQISELMDGMVYDWTPKEPIKEPTGALGDVIRFMKSIFEILSATPTKIIDELCIHIIQHLVGIMESILLSDRVQRVSMEGLRSFGVDVKFLEDFVRNTASQMVPCLREGGNGHTGGMADPIFARLNQLLTMFYEGSGGAWTDYISELTTVGAKKFPSVPPEAVHNLLQKLREDEIKKKTRATKVTNKFKTKKEPNPVKIALKQLEEHLQEYLTKVRDVSVVIGEVAMHQVQRMARLELSSNVRQLLLKDESIKVETASTQDIVDFSPVYRCLHIHFVLGRRDRFIEEYRNERRQQLRLAIKPPTKVDDIQEFKRYFFQIVGFFVVEDTILHTCQSSSGGHKEESEQGLMSQPVLDEFWEMATSEMLSVLRHHCLHCQDNHLLLKIKQLIVWFCHTVMGYGFNNDKLYEVALEIREHYDDLLMKTNGDAFQNLLASDDYTPVIVETDQQFQGIMEMFNYKDLQIHHVPFPKKLPFSSMVIQIYEQIKSFINSSWGYSDRLNLSRTEIDEAVRRSVNLLLTRSLSGCLATLITKDKLTIRQLVQLWVNLDQWEGAEDDLDMYISSVTKVPRSDAAGVQSRLYGFSVFKDAKLSTQVKISSKLEEQISELMDGMVYDWTPKEPIKEPTGALGDVIRFMKSIFEILSATPTKIIDDLCIHIIQHLVGIMESILLSDRVQRVSMEGLRSFGVDVKFLEDFVRNTASQMVPCLREGGNGHTGGMADPIFARLNQLLTMFYEGSGGAWTDYISELTTVGAKKFPSVPPEAVHNLLQKILECERKKKKKFQGMSALKERLKYYDLLLKRLQDIMDERNGRLREDEIKKKTRATKVTNKFKTKKEPNPVKIALKQLEEHLQEQGTADYMIGSRIAMGDRAPSMSRGSPVLFHREGTTHSKASRSSGASK